jgi:kinesin family protein 3/17|tara:strand:- start:301 stop:876 length:576 start_codon:yes stop_codon:yes gene_type:complete
MGGEAVKVVVRCRPQNSKERKAKAQTIVSVDPESAGIKIAPVASSSDAAIAKKPKRFTFDATFGEESTQAGVYEEIGFPLVESVMEGYNGTIFAYGQTGCGKTFTMQGPDVEDPPEELRGVIPRSFQHIFDNVTLNDNVKTKHVITASYIEIYNENVRDLLGADPNTSLALKEHPEKVGRGSARTEGIDCH